MCYIGRKRNCPRAKIHARIRDIAGRDVFLRENPPSRSFSPVKREREKKSRRAGLFRTGFGGESRMRNSNSCARSGRTATTVAAAAAHSLTVVCSTRFYGDEDSLTDTMCTHLRRRLSPESNAPVNEGKYSVRSFPFTFFFYFRFFSLFSRRRK
jgi:hypothetical protein